MEKKKVWIIGGIILAIIAIVIIWARKSKSAVSSTTGSVSTGSGTSVTVNTLPTAGFPLKPGTPYGSYGREVLYVQAYLNKYCGRSLTLDGKYGPLTLAAVVANFYDPEGKQPLKEISEEIYNQTFKPFESKLNEYLNN